MRTGADGDGQRRAVTGGVGRSRAGSVVFAALLVAGPQVAYAQRRQPNIINYSFFITLSDSSDTVAVIAFLGFGHSQSEADTLDLDLVDMTVDAVSASTVMSTRSRSRSEEHTSELQSHHELVCRLLLE